MVSKFLAATASVLPTRVQCSLTGGLMTTVTRSVPCLGGASQAL